MQSLTYLLYIIISIYMGSFLYITYQILFFQQKRFIFIKMIIYFSCIANLIIKLKYKFKTEIILSYIIFFILGVYLGRKSFRNYLLTINKEIKSIFDKTLYRLLYLLKILLIPPVSYFLYCKIKMFFYFQKNPHFKPKTIYELF
jgi:hypothetical protein